jgi:hypothetical protein
VLIRTLSSTRDIHEAPFHINALKKSPACHALRLRHLESEQPLALLFLGALPAASIAGAR